MAGGTTAPLGIDTTVPTPAWMCDFLLGGHDNFAVDRAAALAVSETAPEVRLIGMVNRKFPRRLHAGKRGVKEDDAGHGKATYRSICPAGQ